MQQRLDMERQSVVLRIEQIQIFIKQSIDVSTWSMRVSHRCTASCGGRLYSNERAGHAGLRDSNSSSELTSREISLL